MGGLSYNFSRRLFFYWIQCSTQIQCPEEEHTTCSGGPTIVSVTSAVYGERENYSLKKRIIYKKKENVINNKMRKNGYKIITVKGNHEEMFEYGIKKY